MKRIRLTLLLVCALLLLCACSGQSTSYSAITTLVPGTGNVLPDAQPPAEMNRLGTATLYFRYMDEPYLAPESRVITQTPSRPYEQVLINALLSGPTAHDLNSLFPAGTRVISTTRQGRTLFVTFSGELLDAYPDEPAAWANDPRWQTEVPLRRELCMQGLVATITENCDVDRVQVLVEQDTAVTGSLRLEKRYFMTGETGLADPMTRDDSLLLTAPRTLEVLLKLWQHKDWQRLYLYIARLDGGTGLDRPAYRDFISAMEALPALTEYAFAGSSVSPSGDTATFTLSASLRYRSGVTEQKDDRIIRLRREDGLWRLSMTQLTGWLEVSP